MYIDNSACLAVDADLAKGQVTAAQAALAHVGVVSSLGPASDAPAFIGFDLISRSKRRPTPRKCRRLALGLRHLLDTGPPVSGRDIQRVLGRRIHAFTLKQELPDIFHAIYSFIQGSYLRRQPLWASVFVCVCVV